MAIEHRRNEGLWTNEDETYYNEGEDFRFAVSVGLIILADPNRAPNQNKWHYPANFEGAVGDGRSKRNGAPKANNQNRDRWERSVSPASVRY